MLDVGGKIKNDCHRVEEQPAIILKIGILGVQSGIYRNTSFKRCSHRKLHSSNEVLKSILCSSVAHSLLTLW